MKKILKILILLVLTACSSGTSEETYIKLNSGRKVASFKDTTSIIPPIEIVIVNLNNDIIKDTIFLLDRPEDPGLFKTIKIKLSGSNSFTFNARDAWDKVDNDFLNKNLNLVDSKNVFIHQFGEHTYILLFGFNYGSSRDEFSIIQISDKSARLLFDGDLEEIIAFKDINEDLQIDLVAHNSIDKVDSIESKLKITNGYYVFSLGEYLHFNLPLSKKFNFENPFTED